MKTTSLRARTLACALLATTAYCGLSAQPAHAQATPREFRTLDGNGGDLVQGDFVMSFKEGSIGSGAAEMALLRLGGSDRRPSQWDGIRLQRTVSGTTATIEVWLGNARLERFTGGYLATSFTPVRADGASLDISGWTYVYTAADGTRINFDDPTGSAETQTVNAFCSPGNVSGSCSLLPSQLTRPDGATIDFGWDLWGMPDGSGGTAYEWRLASVANSFGQRIAFAYQSGGNGGSTPPASSWFARSSADFFNDHVSSSSAQASVSYAYPSGSTAGIVDVTDMAGNTWRVTDTSIKRPGESSAGFSVTRSSSTGIVSSVTRDGVTTSYSRSVSGTTSTMTVTDALSHTTTVVSDLNIGRPTSVTDRLSRTTAYSYDSSGRLTRVTSPEGNYVDYTLDSRGNATQTSLVPKSGSGLPTIATTASYPSSCTNAKTCNEPTSSTDARGNTTDYAYDSGTGLVTSVTLPAPTTGATRPETRYSYTLDTGSGVYQLTGVSACATGSSPSCVGTSDEVKSTLAYDSSGNVTSASSGNGSGTLTATSAMAYDAMGNLVTVDGPLSGTADTTRYRYDAARRLVGVTSPDPDGSGSMKPGAVRTTFNSSGLATKVERGSVNSQSDSDWSGFSASEAVETGYDSNFRSTSTKLTSGTTIYALTQTSYDALGRVECVAQRMNPAIFSTITTGACSLGTQGTGSNDFGPDRIVKTAYDAAGEVTTTTSAYGVTGQQADDATATYTSNGLLSTVTDAEGNKTTYDYDGHDRLSKTRFPDTTKGAGTSSTTDYEQLTYETTAGGTQTSGTVAAFRNRAGQSIAFGYDALGRLVSKDLPGTEKDVAYAYDLLGRLTSASFPSTSEAVTNAYDALGRLTSSATNVGVLSQTLSYQHDLAGRTTRLTWPDSNYVDYDHLVTGDVSAIRDNGATSGAGVLATFAYDDLGRRTSLTRGNGVTTSYGYDAVSRLASLAHDLSGTTSDVTFSMTYNPASQIATRSTSNDSYAFNGHGNGTTSSTVNGLNQLSAVGSASVTYDSKGNMTSDGTRTLGYSSENLLTSWSSSAGSMTIDYDPLMRMRYVSGSTYLLSPEGDDMVAEYYGSTLVGRFVHGPGTDEPLVQIDRFGTRTWFLADERGSIAAGTNSSGAAAQIKSYDEYGKPGGSSAYRFGFAGAPVLSPDIYYLRNRFYDWANGKFPQTDPIGYGDGLNLYAYVHGDPINFTDPSGLETREQCAADQEKNSNDSSGKGGILVCAPGLPPASNPLGGHDVGSGPSYGANAKGRQEPPRKPEKQKQQCTVSDDQSQQTGGIAGASVLIPEYVKLGLKVARGTAIRTIIRAGTAEAVEGALAVFGGPVTLAALAVGVGVYAYDRYSGGKITNFINSKLGRYSPVKGCP